MDKKTILLVEDDQFLAKLYASYFADKPYNIVIEPEGEQGLYRMKHGAIDLVILDIIMPKQTGLDVLEARQKDPTLQKIPVIVLTSLEQEADHDKAIELGADDFFSKTEVQLDVLLQKVDTLIYAT